MRLDSTLVLTLTVVTLGASVACAREPEPAAPAAPAAAAKPATSAAPATSATAATAVARDADPFFSGFEPDSTWQIAIDGKISERGEIWVAQKAGNSLVFDLPEFGEVILLQPRQRSVEAVARDAWFVQPDGTGAVAADVAPRNEGTFDFVNEQVSFNYGGKRLELREAPYQLGPKTMGELLASNAHYRFASARYRPSEPIIRNLRGLSTKVQVKVFFGTWCPHCSEVLPKLFSVVQALEGSGLTFSFHGLPKGEGFSTDPESKKYSIRGVPTAVVLVDGKEVGRIDGGSWRIPELGLQNTLMNAEIK